MYNGFMESLKQPKCLIYIYVQIARGSYTVAETVRRVSKPSVIGSQGLLARWLCAADS